MEGFKKLLWAVSVAAFGLATMGFMIWGAGMTGLYDFQSLVPTETLEPAASMPPEREEIRQMETPRSEGTPAPEAVTLGASEPAGGTADSGLPFMEESAEAAPSFSPTPLTKTAEPTPAATPTILSDELTLAPLSQESADLRIGSKLYASGGMKIPALIQHDYKTIVATLNGRDVSVWTSGCGAVVVSMVVLYLKGEENQTPYTLFRWAVENGFYAGSGLWHDALTEMAALYGVRGHWIERDADAILAALSAGKPVIAHMGKGVFTNGGHYIVLRGIAENGEIYVNNPTTFDDSVLTFPLEQIIQESKSDEPFMICEG